MNKVSIFQKIDSRIPIAEVELNKILLKIANPKIADLITFARACDKSGKKRFEEIATYYIDLDMYAGFLNKSNVINSFNEIKDNLVFFQKTSNSVNEKKLKDSGIKYEKLLTIPNFISYFSDLKENYAFISLVWFSYDKTKRDKDGVSGAYHLEYRNTYEYIKCTQTPIVTWNSTFDQKRSLKTIKELSGYIYMDIDDFCGKTATEIRKLLTDNNLTFIKAVWKSFGGKGFGFLIKIENLTVANFKNTWLYYESKFLKELGLKIDKQTKDISRINVLSYDKDIFIRDDKDVTSLPAIDKIEIKTSSVKIELPDDMKWSTLKETVDYFYNDAKAFNSTEGRLSYYFYQHLFAKTNHLGIDREDVFTFLNTYSDEYPNILNNNKYDIHTIRGVAEQQYVTYSDQFGSIQVDNEKYGISDDYNIVKLYQDFVGNKQLKLKYIFNNLKQKEGEVIDLVVKLIIHAKKSGIKIQDTQMFIEQHLGYNPEFNVKLNSIYTNSKYPFGIVVELKKDVFESKRELYIEKKKSENFELVSLLETDEKYCKKTLDKLIFSYKRITLKNIDFLCENYFKICNSCGVDGEYALNYLIDNCDFYLINEYAIFYQKEIYERYKLYFGLSFVKSEIKKKIDFTKSHILNNDKKLSDLNLQIDDNTILWADTNMGKTTWTCNHVKGKRIILVPTIGALKNIESKYDACPFYETKKNVTQSDELIVCTYSSFPVLFNMIQSWGDNFLKNYELFFDEQHNLAVSAEKNYRNNELNFIIDSLSYFKSRRFLTGTYFPIQHPEIKNLNVERVKWENQPIKNAKIIFYEDKIKSIEKRLIAGKKNIIYLQDKKLHKQLGKLILYLKSKGWDGIYMLNADEKNSEHFKSLISTEYLREDAQVIITTSVSVEAINILNLDVETIHFMTFENPRLMEQMVNRMRLKLPKIFIYKKIGSEINNKFIDIVNSQNELITETKRMLKFFSKPKQKNNDTYDLVSAQKIFSNHIFEKSSFFRVKDGDWDVDYLAIAYKIFTQETEICKTNVEYFKNILKEYGWIFSESEIDDDKMNENEKKHFKDVKDEIIIERLEYSQKVLDTIQADGFEQLKKIFNSNDKTIFDNYKYSDIEWDLRKKTIKLSKYMKFEESIKFMLNWVIQHESSDSKYQIAMRQIAIRIGILAGAMNKKVNLDADFTKSVLKMYFDKKENNSFFEKSEIVDLFNRRKKLHVMLKDLDGEKYAIQIFSKYFELIPVIHNSKLKYKFGGLNSSNDVSLFTTEFMLWVNKAHNDEFKFTTDELNKVVNDIRSKLPIMKFYPLNNDECLKLIRDYVTLKKTSKRVDGKVTNIYYVSDLEPELIKGFVVEINQNVLTEDNDIVKTKIILEKNKKYDTKNSSIRIPS